LLPRLMRDAERPTSPDNALSPPRSISEARFATCGEPSSVEAPESSGVRGSTVASAATEEVLSSRAEPMTSKSDVLLVAWVPRLPSEDSSLAGNLIAAGGALVASRGLATEASVEGSSRPTPVAMTEKATNVPADRIAKQIPIADASPPLVKMVLRMPMPSLVFYTPPRLSALRICTATLRSQKSLHD
jgi:hypothetical protein